MSSPSKMPTRHRIAIDRDAPARPPRLGKIRLGVQAQTAKGVSYPKAVDYFVVNEDESGITSPAAAAAFKSVYGEQPKVLHVMLLHAQVEHVLESAWRLYGSSKLKQICDGAQCSVRQPKGGWLDGPCACRAAGLAEDDRNHCSLTHTLWLGLPDLPLGPGLWELDTGSEIGERTLRDYLLFVEKARAEVGGLMFWEFDLQLVPTKVAPDGKSKTVYTLSPVAQASETTLREVITEVRERALPAGARQAQLPPAPVIDEDRDPLISPTPEEQAAAEPELSDAQACAASYKLLSVEQRKRLSELVNVPGVNNKVLAEMYGELARDLPGLLAQLEADVQAADDSTDGGNDQQELS